MAIMEASGTGKTTLMNILGCLDVPTSGMYLLDGWMCSSTTTMRSPPSATRRSGSYSSSSTCWTGLQRSGQRAPPADLRGQVSGRRRRERRVRASGGRPGGPDRLPPGQLSGGQQQRVAIARAFTVPR